MKHLLIFYVAICFSFAAFGQDVINGGLKVAVQGSLVYPGAKVGIEYPVKRIELTKRNDKLIIKDRFLTANVGWYHHPDFHDNIYLTLEWQKRRIGPNGGFTEFSPGIGYSRTFLGGTTYEVNNEGVVTKKDLAGHHYGLVNLGFGAGHDFSINGGAPLAIYTKLSTMILFPYNDFIYLRPTLEAGIILKPQNFLSSSITSIKKSKK